MVSPMLRIGRARRKMMDACLFLCQFVMLSGKGIMYRFRGNLDFRIMGMGNMMSTRFVRIFRTPIVRRWADPWRH